MSALIIPFPLARRQDLVQRQADWFGAQRHEAAEHNLQRQLRVQLDALLRRGVSATVAKAEIEALDAAIRDEVRRHLHAPEARA